MSTVIPAAVVAFFIASRAAGQAPTTGASEPPLDRDLEQTLLAKYRSLSSEQIADLEANAAAGSSEAQFLLGHAYIEGVLVPKNVESGDAAAQVELGVRYARGQGVPLEDSEAVKWEQKAAAQGNPDAFMHLGVRHEHGRGVPKDAEQSVRYFRDAAERGHVIGMRYLGDMYLWGKGVAQSAVLRWVRDRLSNSSFR